jgi:hypothetical protein
MEYPAAYMEVLVAYMEYPAAYMEIVTCISGDSDLYIWRSPLDIWRC